jgi:signal transduction histidine kinase
LERQVEKEISERMRVEEALRQSETEKAVSEERGRLARELHDAVTQTLFSASLIAEVLPRIWEINQERGRQQLEEVRTLTRGALAEMRTLLLELRPEALAKAKMEDLLRQLGRAMTGRTGVPVDVTIEGECKVPSEVQIALYRIAQEALNNAAKHADPSQVSVSLQCIPPATGGDRGGAPEVTLAIRDDGRGFEPENIPAGHFGVGIMRERAAAIGATFEVESAAGRGTQVTVIWSEDEGRRSERTPQ